MFLKYQSQKHQYRKRQHRKYQGSALVIAVFIIVVLSLLGVALFRMNNTSAHSVVYEVAGTRAFQAAQSGMQIKLQELFPLSGGTSCPLTNNPRSISFNNVEGLDGCIAVISCSAKTGYYLVSSQGQCSINAFPRTIYATRKIEVQAREIE